MNRTEHLLSLVAEECVEIAQRATKALRFGLKEVQEGQSFTNAERILREYADLVGVMVMLTEDGLLELPDNFDELAQAKVNKVEKFLAYSKDCGTLDGPEFILVAMPNGDFKNEIGTEELTPGTMIRVREVGKRVQK